MPIATTVTAMTIVDHMVLLISLHLRRGPSGAAGKHSTGEIPATQDTGGGGARVAASGRAGQESRRGVRTVRNTGPRKKSVHPPPRLGSSPDAHRGKQP